VPRSGPLCLDTSAGGPIGYGPFRDIILGFNRWDKTSRVGETAAKCGVLACESGFIGPHGGGTNMIERRLSNQKKSKDSKSPDRAPHDVTAVALAEPRKGKKAWLFGAYTFLFVWGVAYLVLFFTNRLPI